MLTVVMQASSTSLHQKAKHKKAITIHGQTVRLNRLVPHTALPVVLLLRILWSRGFSTAIPLVQATNQ